MRLLMIFYSIVLWKKKKLKETLIKKNLKKYNFDFREFN